MARKESVGSLDETFHEDPIPGLITGMDDDCYEMNLVTAGGRTVGSPLQDDIEGVVDEDEDERVEPYFAGCEMLDMSSLWEELEALGVRTADIDEFVLRFGSSPPPPSSSAKDVWDSGVGSDFFTLTDDGGGTLDEAAACPDLDHERGELYDALKRGGLLLHLRHRAASSKREPNLKAFFEAKIDRIRKWRSSLKTAEEVGTSDSGIGDGASAMAEKKLKQQEEGKRELIKTEEEIRTLRQVLNAKLRHSSELKRKLGITPWKEFTEDMNKGLVTVKESQAYQKSTTAVKSMAVRTTSTLGELGSVISSKLGDMRENSAFKSFEERVAATVDAVKGKVGGSRSSSTQDIASKESEAKRSDGDGGSACQSSQTNTGSV